MDMPLVSVIIPCFNGEVFLRDAIDSVLHQSYANIEIVVVNDGSTDNTAGIMAGYGKKIKPVHQKNQGHSSARNSGIANSTGRYIAFLDCDDYWDHRFVELMLAEIVEKKAAIAYCGWQRVGNKPGEPFIPPDYENDQKLHSLFRFSALWPIHAALVQRDYLPEPAFNTAYQACVDYDLWLRVAGTNPICLVPEVLAFYRFHSHGQVTSNQARSGYFNLLVKERFLSDFPDIATALGPDRIREYCAGAYLKRTYRCLWEGDIQAAHEMFRYAVKRRMITSKDWKYALPALMPLKAYRQLADWRGLKGEG
ncbi:MAG: glycosyltransferase [Desulfobacterales bacterium]|jgi:glycosyltransferase involved in cell wall biosynthesis|nr:glycosyltransferase [Desulfobacterales bacterium]